MVTLPNYINSVKWILWFVVFLQGYPLFCKSLIMAVFLCMNFGGFFRHWWKTKRKKIRQMNFHCTVYGTQEPRGMTLRNHTNSVPWMLAVTSTSYHEWPRSHQLRTMNERGHTNSVPWMNAVCRLRKATFIQTNCVHSWYGVGVTAFIHDREC
jgi:hypothetical protein